MKKLILILGVVTTSVAAKAQPTASTTKESGKVQYSIAWGLFKSKDYAKENTAVFEVAQPQFELTSDTSTNTSEYEMKRILWGAVQWSTKKKTISSTNTTNYEH